MAGVFTDLSRARVSAENAVVQLRKFADTTTNAGLAELLTLGGFTYMMFAENYCSGVPFSNAQPDGSIQYGTPLTTPQMLDTAITRFDLEGGNGLAWISAADPRTAVFRDPGTNKGFDNATAQFDQYRYIDEKAAVTVATGAEARLINAEAALQRGDTVGFLGFLNGLRTAPPTYFLVGDLSLQTQTIAPMAS